MLIRVAEYAIKFLPEDTAFRLVRRMASLTKRSAHSPLERDAMAFAQKRPFGNTNGLAWSWGEAGPLVVLVHGWGGSAAQMAPLALSLSRLGFRCLAPDIRGHGESPLGHTRWRYFIEDVASLQQSIDEEVYAYVAHSAGALTTMAARRLSGIKASRYVCVCAPSHPFPPINVITNKLSPRARLIDRYREYLANEFESSWTRLTEGTSYLDLGPELLLIYDEADRFVPHDEGDKIHALCPGSRLVKTSRYGHTRILAAPELFREIGEFLMSDAPIKQTYAHCFFPSE